MSGDRVTYRRMAAVLEIIQEQATEGFMYFLGWRESLAERYPDYVAARMAALDRIQRLAAIEQIVGTAAVDQWLDNIERRARALPHREAAE